MPSLPTIPEYVAFILTALETAGYEAWCVGGAVRDSLLGLPPGDWDIATSARPEQVQKLFPAYTHPTGLQHGTVTVTLPGWSGVEITTFRRDGAYLDGRHPDAVAFTSSLTEDLSRRDFTVNAMAVNREGVIADPWGGRADLRAGLLRAVGDPAFRFREDALRILRGLRFSARLGFALEDGTAAALRALASRLDGIAPERIRVELEGLLCGSHAARTLLAYPDVLGTVLPEIQPSVGFDQRTRYHCYDVWEHTAYSVDAVPPVPVLRWAMLLHDLGKPAVFTLDAEGHGHFYGHWRESVRIAETILSRLRMDNARKAVILILVERHDAPLAFTRKAVRRNLSQYGEDILRQLLAVKRADTLAHAPAFRDRVSLIDQWEILLDETLAAEDCFSLKQLAVKGGDLTALGLRGSVVGETLRTLLSLVINEDILNDRDILLDYVRRKCLPLS